jgi:nucleoside-diphosphate-sugar epimerase
MRVLITGNRGFVGTETQIFLEECKIEVIGYDLMDGFDIRDPQQFESVIQEKKPDRILHLAAIARFSEADINGFDCYKTNIQGTEMVAKIAGKHHKPIVYASTGSVYMPIKREPPITEEFEAVGNSTYGCDKKRGEDAIQRFSYPWIILRYAHLYGKEKRAHGLIGGYLERIQRGLAPTLNGGKQSNDFTYIKDVATANYLALTASWDKWNQVYNIGTGEELTAEKAGEIVCKASGYTGKVEKKQARTVDPERFVYDTSKSERMLGFKAEYTFEKGLEDMFK